MSDPESQADDARELDHEQQAKRSGMTLWECPCCNRTIAHPPPCYKFAGRVADKISLTFNP